MQEISWTVNLKPSNMNYVNLRDNGQLVQIAGKKYEQELPKEFNPVMRSNSTTANILINFMVIVSHFYNHMKACLDSEDLLSVFGDKEGKLLLVFDGYDSAQLNEALGQGLFDSSLRFDANSLTALANTITDPFAQLSVRHYSADYSTVVNHYEHTRLVSDCVEVCAIMPQSFINTHGLSDNARGILLEYDSKVVEEYRTDGDIHPEDYVMMIDDSGDVSVFCISDTVADMASGSVEGTKLQTLYTQHIREQAALLNKDSAKRSKLAAQRASNKAKAKEKARAKAKAKKRIKR